MTINLSSTMRFFRVFLSVFLLPTSLVSLAHASKVVRSVESDLSYDENGKLTTHVLLYEGSEACINKGLDMVEHPKYQVYEVVGEALDTIFRASTEGVRSCRAVCVEKGVDKAYAHAVMPHRHFDHPLAVNHRKTFKTWFQDVCTRVEVCLVNYVDDQNPINVYWIKDDGTKQFHLEILFGEPATRCFATFLGHKFEAVDVNGNVVGELEVEHITTMAFGTSPESGKSELHNFDDEIIETLNHEWDRHNRVTRSFSPLGFQKGRLPPDVFASMGAFYYNNRFNKLREEWEGKGVFVNWWESDVYVIQIPWGLKEIWQGRLRELVEAWAGEPVEQTVMYGLRQYESGARLLTHVDRHVTHAVSLIVNVAQGNLTEPWPVEVQDHADRVHEVVMEPGDIVYYESAKCLHGRNRPMKGKGAYYTNLFTHYRPVGDDDWFTRDNPPGTPKPIKDNVVGECHVSDVGTTEVANGQVGLVHSVVCDDTRLGRNLSPTLFKAKSGSDLIEWWKMTGPPENTVSGGNDEL